MTYDAVVWGGDTVTWENAPDDIKEHYAHQRLFWYYKMREHGGPDGSELDQLVYDQAREAAEWFEPILDERASRARPTAP